MKTKTTFLALILAVITMAGYSQACVDFESQLMGTNYGNGINSIGDVIFTENDIPVTVEYFDWTGGGGTFGTATVVAGIGSPNGVFMSNINFKFDFDNVGYLVTWVTFDYIDQGGNENLSINGSPIFAGEIEDFIVPPGIVMVIDDMGTHMRVTIAGELHTLLVGGQEFTLDNVCAMQKEDPGPCVEFETIPIGAMFGDPMNAIGDFIFGESSMPVFVDYFYYEGSGGTFNNCWVIDGSGTFGTGNAMWTSNINLKVAFTNVPFNVNKVTFDFNDGGGNENFAINGMPVFAGEIEMALTPPGYYFFITDMGAYKQGTIIGYAPIDTLLIGGQEFEIDNICPDHVDFNMNCVDFEEQALGTLYGTGVNSPGDMIFTQNDIIVTVEDFYYDGGGTNFGFGEIMNASGIGTGQAMRLSNMNLQFDFSAFAALPGMVTFDYADYGGYENLGVNGSAVYIGDLITASIPGVGIGVSQTGNVGQVVIDGPVEKLLVGGQEFFVDNICAHFAVGIDDPDGIVPESNALLGQNYPNPFSGSTIIPFTVTEKTRVVITIYNHLGQQLSTLTDAVYDVGDHTLAWSSQGISEGLYFYQLRTPDFMQSRKLSVGR